LSSLLLAVAPHPDMSQTVTSTTADTLLIVCLVAGGLCVLGGLVELIVRRTAVLLCCCVGGFLLVIPEPLWDVLGHLWFNNGNHLAYTVFSHLDVPVNYPWWSLALYIQFGGIGAYGFFLAFSRRASARTLWLFCGGQFVMNLVVEVPLIRFGAYQYYGEQPFRILGFPLWWAFTNFGELVAGAALFWLMARYGRKAAVAAVILVPSAFAAWELWAGWPIYAALNFGANSIVLHVVALVTAAISVTTIHVIIRSSGALYASADRVRNSAAEAATPQPATLVG
jgi:hypothetical protein